MKIYRLHFSQHLALDSQQAWDFFSSANYLNAITPDFFNVQITSPVPEKIYGGLLICYQMKVLYGFPMTWVSEVTQCDEPQRFVYQQLEGPFRFFSHEVCITQLEDGVMIEDIVYYAMPLCFLGNLFHRLLIGKRLQHIFTHRAEILRQKWG
jgi:ligand-binding SRPBCC domain-containing protein